MSTPASGGKNPATQQQSGSAKRIKVATRTALQLYYIHRLENLITLRNSYEVEAPTEEWLVPAVNKAIYSTYLDCIEYKVGNDAKALFKKELHTN